MFTSELCLEVDFTEERFGSSNVDNIARRFFAESSTSVNILDVDETLLWKCNVFYK